MNTYSILCVQYIAVDRLGKKKRGIVYAPTLHDAHGQFRRFGLTPLRLKSRPWKERSVFPPSLTRKELGHFSKQLATLLSSSVPLEQALKIMQQSTSSEHTKIVICKLLQSITHGLSLSQSLRLADPRFKGFYASLVETAERHGDLANCFSELSLIQEKNQHLKQRITKLLIYPALVSLVAIGVSYLMLTRVIPEFESMFNGLGSDLPTFTQSVLHLSQWLQLHAGATVVCVVTGISLFTSLYKKSRRIELILDGVLLKLPVIGITIYHVAQCRICHTLAVTLASGMPITQCLHSAKVTCTNRHIKRRISRATEHLEAGHSLAQSLTIANLLDTTLIQMVAIGEHSGQLESMLNHANDQLTTRVDVQVDQIGQLIEPIMIVVLGSLVGSLVIAMYLPIFQLMDHFG
jgi:type IV pilus assembly protein PilC